MKIGQPKPSEGLKEVGSGMFVTYKSAKIEHNKI
jgi:hypothetical protein